jgi:NADPH:quinone reductase-like Zn-dependent oxidoreductase
MCIRICSTSRSKNGGTLGGVETPYPLWTAFARAVKFQQNLAAGKLKPIIAKTFSLSEIREAHRYMESNQQLGKIVVTV